MGAQQAQAIGAALGEFEGQVVGIRQSPMLGDEHAQGMLPDEGAHGPWVLLAVSGRQVHQRIRMTTTSVLSEFAM